MIPLPGVPSCRKRHSVHEGNALPSKKLLRLPKITGFLLISNAAFPLWKNRNEDTWVACTVHSSSPGGFLWVPILDSSTLNQPAKAYLGSVWNWCIPPSPQFFIAFSHDEPMDSERVFPISFRHFPVFEAPFSCLCYRGGSHCVVPISVFQ